MCLLVLVVIVYVLRVCLCDVVGGRYASRERILLRDERRRVL